LEGIFFVFFGGEEVVLFGVVGMEGSLEYDRYAELTDTHTYLKDGGDLWILTISLMLLYMGIFDVR